MTTRFYRSPPDLERRHWWRYRKMIAYPLVVFGLALYVYSKPPVEEVEVGQSVNVIAPHRIDHCWHDSHYKGVVVMDEFCITYTTERR